MRQFFAILIIMLFPLGLSASDDCFDCHDSHRNTNHAKIDCTACHSDTAELPHREKLKSPDCASCHGTAVKIYGTSVHAEKRLACVECHFVHNLAQGPKTCDFCHPSVAHKTLPSLRKHLAAADCTGCHSRSVRGEIRVRVNTRQPVSTDAIDKDGNSRVDRDEWKDFLAYTRSVVKDSYRITREYAVRGSAHNIGQKAASCYECHGDNTVFRGAIVEVAAPGQRLKLQLDPRSVIPLLPEQDLYGLTSHGKSGVACRDCHASQGRISDRVCIKCHEDVYNIYKSTVHAKGSAANCTDCHDPHKVKTYKELGPSERMEVCIRCHGDHKGKHEWLPHADLHFKYLECSTCHSPRSDKGMVFSIRMRVQGRERDLTYDDIAAAFGSGKTSREVIDLNGDGRIASSEILPFFDALKAATAGTVSVNGSIVVTRVHHDYSAVQERDKVCATCHSDDAPFYRSMYLVLPEKDGFSHMPVKGTVLASMPSSLAVNFVLLGETKVRWSDIKNLFRAKGQERQELIHDLGFKWIDIIGIFIAVLVLFFIVIHIILRVAFRR